MSFDLNPEPILSAALAGGGDLSELFLEESNSLAVVMDNNKIEKVIGGVDRGAGLRLLYDQHTAYAYSNHLTSEGIMPLAGKVSVLAKGSPRAVAQPRALSPGLQQTVLKAPGNAETARKVEMVKAANAAARDFAPQISQVRVVYREQVQRVRIVNSQGVDAYDERVSLVFVVHCVASDGKIIQTGYESAGGSCGLEIFDERDPVEVAKVAAHRAMLVLKADPAPGGAMPVVLSSHAGGTMVHEAVGHGLEGDLVVDGLSVYTGKHGQQVANRLITVLDDSSIPGKRGSFGFDDEGEPSRKNVLIDKGVLKLYMHDRLSAMKMGMETTANGRRESYQRRPIPRMTNTMIAPGDDDPESIIRSTPSGLFVKKMGGGQVNTVNGDFVFEVAEGYLLKDGKIGAPVRGATLTGNGPAVLMEIDRVGNDLGYSIGTCGKDGQGSPVADAQPTLRIPKIVVGGVH